MRHFNYEVDEKDFLTKENYLSNIVFNNDKEKEDCLSNFDKHLKFFNDLSMEEFNNQIIRVINKFKFFQEINDLNDCMFPGIYIMVLDHYKQMYVGCSNNIKKRIIRHWKIKVSKDYLSNSVNKTPMGIDCFKALDTTRIFVWHLDYSGLIKIINIIAEHSNKPLLKNKEYYWLLEDCEGEVIKFIDSRFVCNKYIRNLSISLKRNF